MINQNSNVTLMDQMNQMNQLQGIMQTSQNDNNGQQIVQKKVVNISFRKRDGEPVKTENKSIDTIEQVIQQYKTLSGDDTPNQIFVFNGKKLELDKTVEESGIDNGASIFVIQKN